MQINHSSELDTWLYSQLRASFGWKPREGFHLSGLLTPRREYWQRVDPKTLTDDELGYFIGGRGHEDALGRFAGLVSAETEEVDGIMFRPDFNFLESPAEFKTRRRGLAEEGREAAVYDSYLDQLRGYCALRRRSVGYLFVFSLLEGGTWSPGQGRTPTKPVIRSYKVIFSDEELEVTRAELARRRDALAHALEEKEHSPLPLCHAWQCGKRVKQAGSEPPVCLTCKREFKADWGAGRHQEANPDHEVSIPAAIWNYEPRCKWFTQCAPWLIDGDRRGLQHG